MRTYKRQKVLNPPPTYSSKQYTPSYVLQELDGTKFRTGHPRMHRIQSPGQVDSPVESRLAQHIVDDAAIDIR
jgi:hypothetical protein